MAWCMDSEYPEAGYHPQASKPRRSDPDQERALVERLRPGLRAILRKRMPDSLLVEDLLQEGLMLIVENWRLGKSVIFRSKSCSRTRPPCIWPPMRCAPKIGGCA